MKNIKTVTIFSVLFFTYKAPSLASKSVLDNNNNTEAMIYLPCNKIGDTLQYIQCLHESKEKYVNKPLSILLNDLKFPVKSYTFGISNSRVTTPGIFLSFDDYETTMDKENGAKGLKNPLILYVIFDPPVENADILSKLDYKSRGWGKAQQDYFGKLIVKDL